jgi:hypothetical protein
MSHIIKYLYLFVLLFCSLTGIAQLDNTLLYDTAQNKIAPEKLYFGIDITGLHRNSEYFNNIVEGRTLFATHTIPHFIYSPIENVTLEAGVFLWKDFGNDKYSSVEPFFRFKYKHTNLSLIFGNLEGSLTHNLIEPLYDYERVFTHRTEQGMQVKINTKLLQSDSWLDWRKMIYQDSPFQEKVVGGTNTYFKLFKNERWKIQTPIQLYAYHTGGQINAPTPPDTVRPPMIVMFNAAIGAEISLKPAAGKIKEWVLSGYWVGYSNSSPTITTKLKNGYGIYLNLKMTTTKLGDIYVSYWNGSNYTSLAGGVLYRGESTIPEMAGYTEPHRQLLILRQSTTIHITDELLIQLRCEPYYDILNNIPEIAWGFNLRYNPIFFIGNVKSHSIDK